RHRKPTRANRPSRRVHPFLRRARGGRHPILLQRYGGRDSGCLGRGPHLPPRNPDLRRKPLRPPPPRRPFCGHLWSPRPPKPPLRETAAAAGANSAPAVAPAFPTPAPCYPAACSRFPLDMGFIRAFRERRPPSAALAGGVGTATGRGRRSPRRQVWKFARAIS